MRELWDLWVAYGVEPVWFLSGVCSLFWLVFRVLSLVAHGISRMLEESFADLFAVVYNILLSFAFAATLHLFILLRRPTGAPRLWYTACGFVFLYLVLQVNYADEHDGGLDDYSLLGFFTGPACYLSFPFLPALGKNAATMVLYSLLTRFEDGPTGWILTATGGVGLALYVLRLIRKLGARGAAAAG